MKPRTIYMSTNECKCLLPYADHDRMMRVGKGNKNTGVKSITRIHTCVKSLSLAMIVKQS